jgi:A/G-specific adenine glycosylase
LNSQTIHKLLIGWYQINARQLPWRKNKDPYRIWISEIMCQQTRVEAVLPFYERFLKKFPTVQSLAKSSQDQVVNLWSGLGYYSRARNLQKAAQQIIAQYGGKFPSNPDQLQTLSGIGPYTANAIASMAFGKKVAAIDGNLERVLSRLIDLRENPKKEGRAEIESLAQALVDFGSAGDINQALMDLSSAICLPKNPRCSICPLQADCKANRAASTDLVPLKAKKAPSAELHSKGLLVICRSKLLLARRKPKDWLSGLWDIPWLVMEDKTQLSVPKRWQKFGSHVQSRAITKYKLHFAVDFYRSNSTELPPAPLANTLGAEWKWVAISDLNEINLPRPSQRALAAALAKIQ